MAFRPVMFMVRTPAQSVAAGAVVLFEDVFVDHVSLFHPDTSAEHIIATLEDPCYIHESKTRNDTLVFTSEINVNENGDPLWVPVRIQTSEPHMVTSAYYKQFANPGTIVWERGNG